MNRNHLALFEAVARCGSITRGAAAARVSQPAVSKQIAELEAELGVRLLDRLPRGCRLTEAGAVLAGHARRWLAVEEEAERAIGEIRGLRRGRLAIGASLTIAGYLLPDILAAFRREHPAIELRVEIGNTDMIQSLLSDGSVEVGLTEGVEDSDELQSSVFSHDELVVVAPGGHPLLRKGRRVTVRDVCREPLILREEGSGTRAVVEQALRRRGVTPEPFLSLASPEAIKNCVAAGMGLAIVSRLIVALEVREGLLGIVPVSDLAIRRPLHIQTLRGHGGSPAAALFVRTLEAVGAKGQGVLPP
jgi:DNA-binding transcriptional LysR family regulator